MLLTDKVAIVTGGASGMGLATAELFALEGAKVVVADLNLDGAKKVADTITTNGGTALAIKVDVSSQTDIDNLFKTTLTSFDHLDILINNAGIMDNMAGVADVSDKIWQRVFSINVDSVMMASRAALNLFLPQKSGTIVNIASVGGLRGGVAGAAYTAAKHAVVGLTQNTAYMYNQNGIRCNAIAPGGIATNIAKSMTDLNQTGMQRTQAGAAIMPPTGKAEDIANAALYLSSDQSSYVNGVTLTVDGGWSTY
ncbi:3-ketoacyl-ACP reductase [Paucilactobacillus hokkaidonensis JCM 18461]|uniref:3-ketoacyl-ACP reductase n=2 Tax=Paucilactobacillus hokkaidonensis TaxID=1193095 RepID=A0A0A1GUD5_9LACO|nr:glucose 1-dehydrogenase [Paucilactobacillus hokkaidonensis]KRO09911.1 3-oxoacyl-ACP reductase [Paucilactobacillus hokkaidonensis]BAP85892.1 3-ketoacyl-ACP reductase [Paucilactobacillus hokkaidonensis JCM 18461]